jgi:hypothetical protein
MKVKAAILLVFAYCGSCWAGDICPPLDLPDSTPFELIISESDYNYGNALEAINHLSHITNPEHSKMKGSEQFIVTANSELVLKGYVLRSHCLASNDKDVCEAFCQYHKQMPLWFD